MVLYRSFCMGNGYFSRRFSAESHCLWSDGYLSAETEKGINMDCCRLITNAPRSCTSVENALTSRWRQQPLIEAPHACNDTLPWLISFSLALLLGLVVLWR